jgi:5-amino-6-(5-phosphoribosylamino)uracil reductase
VRRLAPTAEDIVDLRVAYPVPAGRHVRVNFAASVDGATAVDGRSRGLSSDADRELFHLLRAMSDVVLVGAGTARDENYAGAKGDDDRVPPIAVVSRSLNIDPQSRLFTDTRVRPIVITCADAPAERLVTLNEIADVIVAGDDVVDVKLALDALADRGLQRVICEGGPHLFGWLAAAKAYDELCLSLAPIVTGGEAKRMIAGVESELVDPLRLVHVLEDDGHLFLRYSTV